MTENPTGIEPTGLERFSPRLVELIAEVTRASTVLGTALNPETALSLAALVRMMNCYYSNQIEGHDTKPREIEEGLTSAEVAPGPRRHLLLEARAHVQVQRSIDELALRGGLGEPASGSFVRKLHRDFYLGADLQLLTVGEGDKSFVMSPGEWRSVEVAVGRHLPPDARSVPAFIEHFERRYAVAGMPLSEQLVAFASAHHRFNFIHPFPDGNGRVSRLMTHAMGHAIGIGAHGLWSISRGLARGRTPGAEGRKEYLQMMQLADAPREGALDGRGFLSLRRLEQFVEWFLEVCLDQLRFMSRAFDLANLEGRLVSWVKQLELHPKAAVLAKELLHRGDMARGEVSAVTGLPERTARTVLSALERHRLVASPTPRGRIALHFGVESAEALFPSLF